MATERTEKSLRSVKEAIFAFAPSPSNKLATAAMRRLERGPRLALLLALLLAAPYPRTHAAPRSLQNPDEFLRSANLGLGERLNDLTHAQWNMAARATNVTRQASERALIRLMDFVAVLSRNSTRYDRMKDRHSSGASTLWHLSMLQSIGPPAPEDVNNRELLARLISSLTQHYASVSKKGNGVKDISQRLEGASDYRVLQELWAEWYEMTSGLGHAFAQMVTLSNLGAENLAYDDTGKLWRAALFMDSAAVNADVAAAWTAVKPLYTSLHCWVRSRLSSIHGTAAVPQQRAHPRPGPARRVGQRLDVHLLQRQAFPGGAAGLQPVGRAAQATTEQPHQHGEIRRRFLQRSGLLRSGRAAPGVLRPPGHAIPEPRRAGPHLPPGGREP